MSGWWLGTWISWLSIILGIILPFDFHVFQRGWNHQPVNILSTTWKITMFELPSRFKKNQRWPIKSHKKVPKSTCEVRPRDPSRSLPPHAGLMWTKWAQTSGSQRQSGPLYMNIMKTSPLDECNECNQTYWWKITLGRLHKCIQDDKQTARFDTLFKIAPELHPANHFFGLANRNIRSGPLFFWYCRHVHQIGINQHLALRTTHSGISSWQAMDPQDFNHLPKKKFARILRKGLKGSEKSEKWSKSQVGTCANHMVLRNLEEAWFSMVSKGWNQEYLRPMGVFHIRWMELSTMNQPWISMNHRHLIFEYLRYLWVFQVQISGWPMLHGSPGMVSTTSALGPSADAVGWTNASGIPS